MIVFYRHDKRGGPITAFFFGSDGYLTFDNEWTGREVIEHWQKWIEGDR